MSLDPRRTASVLVALVVAGLACLAPAADADAPPVAWGAPVEISGAASYGSFSPRVAADPEGQAVATWVLGGRIRAATRSPYDSWGPVATLSPEGGRPSAAAVGIDAVGGATAIWRSISGSEYQDFAIETAYMKPGGSWSAPESLYTGGPAVGESELAVDSAGDAVAVWWRSIARHSEVIESSRRPAGGRWTMPVAISAVGYELGEPRVAIDSAGGASVVWQGSQGLYSPIETATMSSDGDWSPPVVLSASRDADPTIAVDPEGDAVATWTEVDAPDRIVKAAERPAGDGWSPAATISSQADVGYQLAYPPRVAIDPTGDAVAVWGEYLAGTGYEVRSARFTAGGGWAAPDGLGYSDEEPDESVTMNPDGTAVPAWSRYLSGSYGVIEAARQPPTGDWEPQEAIALQDDRVGGEVRRAPVEVAADSLGAVAVWEEWGGTSIQAAVLGEVHGLTVAVEGDGTGVIESDPGGIACGEECSLQMVEGEEIVLAGAPGPESAPVAWTGCPGVVDPADRCDVTMHGTDQHVVATFARATQSSPTEDRQPSPTAAIGQSGLVVTTKRPPKPTLRRITTHRKPPRGPGTEFTFAAPEASGGFTCSIDGGIFKACSSPIFYPHLSRGTHVFRVKALGAGGLQSPPRSLSFFVGRPHR